MRRQAEVSRPAQVDAAMPVLLALPPPDPGFELVLASQGTSQGVAQTDGVQVIPRAYVRIGSAQIGGQWRNIRSRSATGVAAFFLKFSGKVGGTQLEAGVAHRLRTGVKGSTDAKAWEISGGARRSFGRVGLRFSAEYSSKEFENGPSLYVDMGPAFDVDKVTKVSANIGRRERDGGPDYTSFNAGISRVIERRLTLDARYYTTDRAGIDARYRGHLVLSTRLAL